MIEKKGYTLRFPFRLAPGQEIIDLDQPYKFEHTGIYLQLRAESGMYYFSAELFPEELAGKAFIPKLWAGLMWTLLHRGLSLTVNSSPQKIRYFDNPQAVAKNLGLKVQKIDSILDDSRPAVYEEDKAVSTIIGHQASLTQGFNPESIVSFIKEALSLPHPEGILSDKKLKVALDLYNAFFWESSVNARFLTLNMALEALAPQKLKHQCAIDAIERWMVEIEKLISSVDPDSEEFFAYESLKREVGFRKEQSIRSSIRHLVGSTLKGTDPEAEDLALRAVHLYDVRSRLVHDGHVQGEDLGQNINEIRDIAFRVLRNRFLKVASTE